MGQKHKFKSSRGWLYVLGSSVIFGEEIKDEYVQTTKPAQYQTYHLYLSKNSNYERGKIK